MIDISKINDPEYRWYHKREMTEILTDYHKRNDMGIITLNYQRLREEYLKTIKETRLHALDWSRFKHLIDSVPIRAYGEKTKTKLQPRDMYHFELRDKCACYLCGTISRYTEFHHIIPTGDTSDENIVTLCESCHKMVHIALYASGKRRGFY
jgi:5-methylcytosine-specific restriction endonuclease McrA